jgi:hypothetical protein
MASQRKASSLTIAMLHYRTRTRIKVDWRKLPLPFQPKSRRDERPTLFIRRLGLALQNAPTELYQDFRNASFYLDPCDALTATCWLKNLQRVAEWVRLLDIAQETIAHELLKLAGWSHVIEKEHEAGRRLVTVAAARGDEPNYIVDLNIDLGFADYA